MALTNNLSFITWNVTGVMSSASYLCDILSEGDIDICGISEHWLTVNNMYFLGSINSKYDYVGSVSKSIQQRGHGQGGVAIMWHKRLSPFIVPFDVDDDRIVGIQVQTNELYMYIFQVYLPSSNHSIHDFRQCLVKLFELYNTYSDNGTCIIMGDFNANLIRCSLQPRDRDLMQFITDCNLCAVNLLDSCHGSPYSFVSYNDQYYSMIDYVLISREMLDLVTHCEIATDSCLNVSRHKPILFYLDSTIVRSVGNDKHVQSVNWRRVNVQMLDQYCMLINRDNDIQAIASGELDEHDINSAYHTICNKVKDYSQKVFPQKSYKTFLKPYWSSELNDLHVQMVMLRRAWCRAGRPRDPDVPEYQHYKNGKTAFRRAHRQCVLRYLSSLDDDLEEAARSNSTIFWNLVRSRRGKFRSTLGAGIRFDGEVYRSREDLTGQWARYFQRLYEPSISPNFDEEWKETVSISVNDYFSSVTMDNNVTVFPELVMECVQSLPNGKAGGADGLTYEHLKCCVDVISPPLANIYTYMLRRGHIPIDMKKGEIITLHKGGKKDKCNPDNYRAITLSSVILKIYEMILLKNCEQQILDKLNKQQCGFQKQLGCDLTSFVLHETVHYARENSSQIYVCFLDARKAFDNVWHQGLLYKLIELNVDVNTMVAIKELYDGASCHVKYNGLCSGQFPVLQGTRQGAKSSPLMYLVFIDGLIKLIERSDLGACVYNTHVSSPTVADDMALVSFSRSGLEQLLDICYTYACKWRYFYNADKCAVVTFNKMHEAELEEPFIFGNDVIRETDDQVHLGVRLENTLSCKKQMYEAGIKLRGTFMNLFQNGIKSENVSPKVLRTIYMSEVIPKVLYGCEHWTSYSKQDILTLQTAHLYCIKFMQRLSKYSCSEYAMVTVDIPPIEVLIDKRKLLMLGRLCHLPCEFIAKEIFVNRLISYRANQRGFIPDIFRILMKYNMKHSIDDYVTSGNFPSKITWKRQVRMSVDITWKSSAVNHLTGSLGVLAETGVIQTVGDSILWDIVSHRPYYKLICCRVSSLIAMLVSKRDNWKCGKCNKLTKHLVAHLFFYCEMNQQSIMSLLRLLTDVETQDQFMTRISQPVIEQCREILRVLVLLLIGNIYYPDLHLVLKTILCN